MNEDRRPPIFLLTGLVIGLVLGLVYAWVLMPVESVETDPSTLSDGYKDAYREIIAEAYIANGDLGRAIARLALLGDEDPVRALTVQAQLTLGEEGSETIAQALGILAANLAGETGPLPTTETTQEVATGTIPTNDVQEPAETSTPTSTATHAPTETTDLEESTTPDETGDLTTPTAILPLTQVASPTAGAPFTLLEIALDCGREYDVPLIQVNALNAVNIPVAGVQIVVTWDNGVDTFYTGFKPELGQGYADFEMTPGIIYTLQLTKGDKPVTGLISEDCPSNSGARYWGSWRLTFKQP